MLTFIIFLKAQRGNYYVVRGTMGALLLSRGHNIGHYMCTITVEDTIIFSYCYDTIIFGEQYLGASGTVTGGNGAATGT